MMEKKIKTLLDFQRFQQNSKLNSVLQDVEGRYAAALDDDDLALVSAAGEGALLPMENPGMMAPEAGTMIMADTREGIVICPPITQQDGR